MQFHPASEIFPLMNGSAFDDLVADIKANGLGEDIWLHSDGSILDGRNRLRACEQAGIEPRFRTWDGEGSPITFVVSMNLHRRHLSESQRAMIASKVANIPRGFHKERNPKQDMQICTSSSEPLVSVPDAAEMLNVSDRLVATARAVQKHGVPALAKAVEDGLVSLNAADSIRKEPAPEQANILRARREARVQKLRGNGVVAKTRKHKGRKAPEAIRGAIGTLVGLVSGLDSFTVKDAAPTPEEAAQWEKELVLVISAINRFRRQLKEVAHA